MNKYQVTINGKLFVAERPKVKVLRKFLEMTKDGTDVSADSFDSWVQILKASFAKITDKDIDEIFADQLLEIIEGVAKWLSESMGSGKAKN